jgi:hypothetical protein
MRPVRRIGNDDGRLPPTPYGAPSTGAGPRQTIRQTYDHVMSGDPAAGSPAPVGGWEIMTFVCELAMLAALSVVGWQLGPSVPVGLTLAFALPGTTGLVWGMWLAPRARRRLAEPTLTTAKTFVFVATGVVLALVGQILWAAVLTIGSVVSAVMLARHRG